METTLTDRQKKWFASVRASLQRDTGRTLDEWVAIALTCPEIRPRARAAWLKDNYGLGVNRAAQILGAAFPSEQGWDNGAQLRAALWSDAKSAAILMAVESAISDMEGVVHGQRKGFSAWSRKVQFAAIKPVKGGMASLGLAIDPSTDPRLQIPKTESWSERLISKLALTAPGDVDASVRALLRLAWEAS